MGVSYPPRMTDRAVATRAASHRTGAPGSRRALRVRRVLATLIVLVGLLIGLDYAAAAAAESVVSREMRQQLNLADDPSVRFNNFPFLAQAIAGTYKSVDVTADHLTVGPLRDVQLRTQLRGVRAPLSELLGGARTLSVREAEGTVRVGAPDLEKLVQARIATSGLPLTVDKLYIDGMDAAGLERAVEEDGADPAVLRIDPPTAARIGGTLDVAGQLKTPVTVIAELQLAAGEAQIVPRDVRIGDVGDDDPLPVPLPRAQVEEAIAQVLALRLRPGDLPLQVTPTKLRATSGGLEISGLTGRLTLGASGVTG